MEIEEKERFEVERRERTFWSCEKRSGREERERIGWSKKRERTNGGWEKR